LIAPVSVGCALGSESTQDRAQAATATECGHVQSWVSNDWRLSFSEGEIVEHLGELYRANQSISYPNAECAPNDPVSWCESWFSPLDGCDSDTDPVASCDDGIQNQGEEDIDCGGPCSSCGEQETCSDGVQNQGETGVDCGGPCDACGSPPSASFELPLAGVEVDGGLSQVKVNAADEDGIDNVKLYIDGNLVRQENVDPYTWSSSKDSALNDLSAGEHELRAVVTDGSGETAEVVMSVSVSEHEEPEPPANGVNCAGDLEDCYADMADAGGGTIVLDAKTYYLDSAITIQSNISIVGQGMGRTTLAWSSPQNKAMFNRTSGSTTNMSWSDLKIDCGGNFNTNPGWTSARGVYLSGGGDPSNSSSLDHSNFSMENVEIVNCGGEGIQVKGARGISLLDVDFHDNGYGENNNSLWHNMYLKRARDIVIRRSRFTDSPVGHGMRMSQLENVALEDVVITGNGEHGIHADNCHDFVGDNVTTANNCQVPEGACHEVKCFQTCSNFNP